MVIRVAKSGERYTEIGAALEQAARYGGEPVEIHIGPGVYQENIVVVGDDIQLIGENPEGTVIRAGLYAKQMMEDGTARGTFRTATVRTDGDGIVLRNLTIENNAGNGRDYGQAVALYADSDDLLVENCHLLGHQDTLFTAPLPPTNKQGKTTGFGPKQNAPRKKNRQVFRDCYIEGDVDFIFGGAMVYFEKCTIYSKNRVIEEGHDECKGYVTAPCTPGDQEFGYLFYECKFLSDCPKQSVYLSRPWRQYAKSVVIKSFLDEHIKKEGYHDWDNPEARKTTYYAEGNNWGTGSKWERADWAYQLTDGDSETYVTRFLERMEDVL